MAIALTDAIALERKGCCVADHVVDLPHIERIVVHRGGTTALRGREMNMDFLRFSCTLDHCKYFLIEGAASACSLTAVALALHPISGFLVALVRGVTGTGASPFLRISRHWDLRLGTR